jgi:hypothetical protein
VLENPADPHVPEREEAGRYSKRRSNVVQLEFRVPVAHIETSVFHSKEG